MAPFLKTKLFSATRLSDCTSWLVSMAGGVSPSCVKMINSHISISNGASSEHRVVACISIAFLQCEVRVSIQCSMVRTDRSRKRSHCRGEKTIYGRGGRAYQVKRASIVMSTCALYIVLSSCLINYNKFLMHPGRFPHAVP